MTSRISGPHIPVQVMNVAQIEAAETLPVSIQGALGDVTLDAFGRQRVSDPITVFDSQLQYNLQPLLWESSIVGGGSVTHLPNQSSAALVVDTSSGASVVRQTHRYFRYQPGKSQLIVMTGILGNSKQGVRQRIGYFDDQNGAYFENTAEGLAAVVRSFSSGVVSNNRAVQAEWNVDKMDGTGVSGITLDPSKSLIFLIDLEWLGVGTVRFGVVVNGIIYYCHLAHHSNILSGAYMTTANLPLRYEITNTSNTSSSTTMIQTCSTVISEGGLDDDYGYIFSTNNGISGLSVTSRVPVMTIRPKATFNSITNRGYIQPIQVDILPSSSALIEVIYNGTLSGGSAAFTSAGGNSLVEYNTGYAAITGGDVVQSFFSGSSGANRTASQRGILNKLLLTLDKAGTTPDTLTIVATSITGASVILAAMIWKEIY